MSKPFKLRGICVCGHDPEEDPNEDCERCWLITQIDDLTMKVVESDDGAGALRCRIQKLEGELALERESNKMATSARDFAIATLSHANRKAGWFEGLLSSLLLQLESRIPANVFNDTSVYPDDYRWHLVLDIGLIRRTRAAFGNQKD